MDLVIRACEARPPGSQPVEIVERKGIGHPDTICDALAERISVRLSQYYQERFGTILHYNVDKILLCAGSANPRFGGGDVTSPIDLYLAGRATMTHEGEPIPVADLAVEACRDWFRANLEGVNVDQHVQIVPRLRPGSGELTRLFGKAEWSPRANDTSFGVGFAPRTDLERVVLEVERTLNGTETRRSHSAIGRDIKVMGLRRGTRIELTIGCAFVDRFLVDAKDYLRNKDNTPGGSRSRRPAASQLLRSKLS